MPSIRYRAWQTLQALTANWRPVDDHLAEAALPPALYNCYRSMSRNDRQHHLRVYRRLVADGHHQPALLQAALLHDLGKTRYRFSVLDRIWVVIVKTLLPRQFDRWGQAEPVGWRRPIVISAQHPAWSAEMVNAAGGDPLTVELIARHQDPITPDLSPNVRKLLPILQAADDAS